ncbi:hypothetical protein [Capnocytophaga canimorsus]|uniref:hypothetical protein n=1 Tax=Capnocytophaga canimorsus TaxID=28188 RepID=UPI0013DE12F4|nr:hypothetical protein [Capnocytophaga canimorsus]
MVFTNTESPFSGKSKRTKTPLSAATIKGNVPIIPAGMLNGDTMLQCDLGITAHSFDYIGKRTLIFRI